MNRMTVAAIALASALCAALWVAWLESPERAALLKDQRRAKHERSIAAIRQEIASEQADLIRGRADCLADKIQFGKEFGDATCAAFALEAELAGKRIEAMRKQLEALESSRDAGQ